MTLRLLGRMLNHCVTGDLWKAIKLGSCDGTKKRGMDWWYGMVVSLVRLVSNFASEIEQGRFCFLRTEFA